MSATIRHLMIGCVAVAFCLTASLPASAAASPACDSDNGGIKLPTGFCALVAADNLGAARHAVAAANGDLFVALQNGGIVGLHDSTGNGRFDVKNTLVKEASPESAFTTDISISQHQQRLSATNGRLAN